MGRFPKISVLMPVFNAGPFLAAAIESIFAQTFEDFEFIIVDDGSYDGSQSLIEEYARRDSRIKVLLNEKNIGIADTLNKGLRVCRGEYIARMDADDVSHPKRFELQVAFMDKNPDVGVSGTWYTVFGHASGTHRNPLTDAEIKIHHLFRDSAIGHPTVIFRRRLIEQTGITFASRDFPAEDLWFWIRLGFVAKFANLPELLLNYRTHQNQVSETRRSLQQSKAAEAQVFFASRLLGRPLTELEKNSHSVLTGRSSVTDGLELERVRDYGTRLLKANAVATVMDQVVLDSAIRERLITALRRYAEQCYKYAAKYDISLLAKFLRDPLRPFGSLNGNEILRFAVKCVICHVPRQR